MTINKTSYNPKPFIKKLNTSATRLLDSANDLFGKLANYSARFSSDVAPFNKREAPTKNFVAKSRADIAKLVLEAHKPFVEAQLDLEQTIKDEVLGHPANTKYREKCDGAQKVVDETSKNKQELKKQGVVVEGDIVTVNHRAAVQQMRRALKQAFENFDDVVSGLGNLSVAKLFKVVNKFQLSSRIALQAGNDLAAINGEEIRNKVIPKDLRLVVDRGFKQFSQMWSVIVENLDLKKQFISSTDFASKIKNEKESFINELENYKAPEKESSESKTKTSGLETDSKSITGLKDSFQEILEIIESLFGAENIEAQTLIALANKLEAVEPILEALIKACNKATNYESISEQLEPVHTLVAGSVSHLKMNAQQEKSRYADFTRELKKSLSLLKMKLKALIPTMVNIDYELATVGGEVSDQRRLNELFVKKGGPFNGRFKNI